jgi:hypothetical protein
LRPSGDETWPCPACQFWPCISYSLNVSILVEIAERADVSVEGVVRVLTREPVSDAVKERVLDVLDDLTPEQTRAVQRFALAALHDDVSRAGGSSAVEDPAAAPDPSQLALPVAPGDPALSPGHGSDTALVQLSAVLGELAEAVRDLRRETDAERRERVDDLAVLIDLITTGWQGLDARLGRIERQVSRLEAGRREPIAAAPAPVRVVPTAVEAAPAAAAPIEPAPAPPVRPSKRNRLPFVAALTLVGAGVVTLTVLQLASGEPDLSRLVSARESSSTTGEIPGTTAPVTTRPAGTTARPAAQKPVGPATTSNVLGTTAATTRPKPPAARTTAPQATSAPPAETTRPATTAAVATSFKPTRNWAWAPVQGADYYDVSFSRAGTAFYRATPAEPRLTLPSAVVFRPGPYRWVVRPGFGARSAKNLGAPVVDSAFTVS